MKIKIIIVFESKLIHFRHLMGKNLSVDYPIIEEKTFLLFRVIT
jgi:hypothetical protein